MLKKSNKYLLETIGLCLLAAYCLLASIFMANFSKVHISLGFLNFPIFIGEILLLICLIIYSVLICKKRVQLIRGHQIFFVYFIFILLWVTADYFRFHHQALALRNGTLFIYPIFLLFSYSFYNPSFLALRTLLLLAVLLYLTALISFNGITSFACLILFVLVASTALEGKKRWTVLGLALIIWPYGAFLSGARTWLVAGVISILFLIIIFIKYFLPINKKYKIFFNLILMAVFLIGAAHIADKSNLESLLSPQKVIQNYQEVKARIKSREASFHPRNLPVNLYNADLETSKTLTNVIKRSERSTVLKVLESAPVSTNNRGSSKPSVLLKPALLSPVEIPKGKIETQKISLEKENKKKEQSLPKQKIKVEVQKSSSVQPTLEPVKTILTKPIIKEPKNKENESVSLQEKSKSLSIAYNNVAFRLLIWEDMIKELKERKSWFGVGMGWPQRSRSIEILEWADSEWSREGWITPHNSYLHLIYRGGLLGVGIIVLIFVTFYGLVVRFIKARSWQGLLLTSIILYGLIAANFLLIFELPYYAIPYWTIWGWTLAYRDRMKI